MRLYPEKLAAHLKQQCLPVYLITGDETLLVQECSDLVRAAARDAGCSDREILDTSASGFDWQSLPNCATEMSLFGDRKLVELRLPSGKPGAEGGRALTDYLERAANGDDVLLVVSGKIDRQSQNSKWFKALDKAGAWLQLWPVTPEELPRWLRQRLGAAGMTIDNDALELLAERVEGNLLAAVQEVEKLKLLAPDQHVTAETITSAVLDNARFNLFAMADAALKGDAAGSLRMLRGLRGEGAEPSVVLWALAREVRGLYAIGVDCDNGHNIQQAMQTHRVWKNRAPLVQAALKRHDLPSLGALLQLAAQVDGGIKGYADGRPWDLLDQLTVRLAGRAGTR